MSLIRHPNVGQVYYAPCSDACVTAPLVYGEHRGFDLAPTQSCAALYESRELAEAALCDPEVWHPSRAEGVRVAAVLYTGGHRCAFASEAEAEAHREWCLSRGATVY